MSDKPVAPTTPKSFNIIALDGGGTRGTLEAVLLDRLLKEFPKLLRDTDLIAGTSTGGIQALGLAAGAPVPQVRDMYEKAAKFIFSDSFADDFRDLWKLTGADYSNKNLRKLLRLQFGEMTLGELDKRVVITSFDLDNEASDPSVRTWKPKIYHNFDNSDSDSSELVVDVALRTSAAPTYFPTVDGFVDGGVIATNPSLIAITQALDAKRGAGADLADIRLLSLGAGKTNRYIKGNNHDWGIARWIGYLFDLFGEGSVELVAFQAEQLLGDRYHRINPHLRDSFALDNWKKIPPMVEMAEELDLTRTVEWLEENWI